MKNLFSFSFVRPKFHNSIIDGVRAFSILIVVVGHLLLFYRPFYTKTEDTSRLSVFFDFFRSDLAVDAFFVISGFLIGSILFKEYQKNLSLSFKGFYLKRFFRLMPVYFVSIFLGILFYSLVKSGNPDVADKTYIEPITLEVLEKILIKETLLLRMNLYGPLFTVSAYSFSGLLSATTPAPACT